MPASQPANFNLQEFSDAGLLLLGGRLYTYAYGTTAQKTAYTDPAGAVPHTYTADGTGGQYIALNARGELPAPLYFAPGAYDIALKRADGSTVWTRRADPTGDLTATLRTDLAASPGTGLLGWIQTGIGAMLRSAQDKLRERVSVFDYMTAVQITDAQGTTSTGSDHTAAIQAAINALNQANKGGILFFPRGRYRTTAMLTMPWTGSGIIFQGEGGVDQSVDGVSTIYGNHTQDAILSLQGSVFCRINDLCLDGGNGATYPKTGLLLGRNGAGSAGWHVFDRLSIIGRFSVACHYNVASEGNSYRDCWFSLDAGASATKCVYLSGGDSGGLAPATALTGSTLLGVEFLNCHIYHMALTAGISAVYIDGSAALGSIAFRGGYLVQANGHFVSIRNGTIDGHDTLGPITFDGVGGERPGGVGVPISGFNLFASVGAPAYLRGLNIRNCRFLMAAGNYILQDAYVKLANAVILSQGVDSTNPAALVYRPSLIGSNKIGLSAVNNGENLNCLIDVGSGLQVEAANQVTFTGAWGQTFSLGNGFGIVTYQKDLFNNVTLEGAPDGGVSGTSVFTLPVGYRPITTKVFSTLSNNSTIAGQGDTTVVVNTNGTVVVTGGTLPVYLTGISFSCLR